MQKSQIDLLENKITTIHSPYAVHNQNYTEKDKPVVEMEFLEEKPLQTEDPKYD